MVGEESLTKKTFRWNPPDRKKRDNTKNTWLYGVLEDLEKNIAENLW